MNPRGPITAGVVFLMAIGPATAQVQLGPFNMTGNGTLSAGYTGNYGNLTESDHGLTFGGAGTLTGSFYNPNFLSFNIQPFLNQSRENSSYQSISDSSGVNASTGIFSGSNFPGSVAYTRTFNSQGNFAVPGVADFTSHGDSQVLNVAWSENLPNMPSVSAGFLQGNDSYSLYGATGELTSSYRSYQVQSNYRIAGFNLNGSFRDSVTDSQTPEVLGNPAESTTSRSETVSFGVGHALPFHGSFSASASHSDIDADYSEGSYKASMDTVSSGIGFSPIGTLNVGANFQYTDNLAASLDQAIVAAGGEVQGAPEGTHSLSMTAYINYSVPSVHLTFGGTDQFRQQNFLGESYQSNAYTGSVTYSNALLGGYVNASVAASRSQVSSSAQGVIGLSSSLNYSRDVKGWSTSTVFHYAENAETALIAYTNTGYGYSGTLGRHFGRKSHWSASAAGSRSTLTNQAGSASFGQSYSTVLSVRWIGISGSYSKSVGNSVLTSSGLTPITVPLSVIAPSSVILYGGHAYSGGLGLTPFRGFTLSASYSQAFSNTQGDSVSSNNRTQQLSTYLQYQVRKLYFTAGYSRLTQSFTSNGDVPAMVGSFYFGISRWFNFL